MFKRFLLTAILQRLREPRPFIQVLAGPRQAGKTTLAHYLQLLEGAGMVNMNSEFIS